MRTEQTFGKLKQKPTNLGHCLGFKNPSLIHLVLTYLLYINDQFQLFCNVQLEKNGNFLRDISRY